MRFGALCLILLYGLIGSYADQPCLLITPNVLRVDSEETIIVDGQGAEFEADITVQDFPRRTYFLTTSKVSVNQTSKFFGNVKLTIPSDNLEKDPNKKQFVYVSMKSPVCTLEKVVLVSYQSGFIFIQTDKPIYTPGSRVLYRLFTMTPDLNPTRKSVIIEFLTPENVLVKRDLIQSTGITPLTYALSDLVSLGIWTISAKFDDSAVQNFTAQFEVKEYVLPSFEIKITTSKKFFHIKDEELRVDIEANYLYGKPVNGKAFVLFGIKRDNEKTSLSDTLRRIEITDGEGFTVLRRQDLVKYFKEELDMLQYTLYVSVTVITDSGSELLESELENIYFVTSPYKILYTKTSKFFKPGMPFDLMVYVTNPDGTPADRVPVVAEPANVRGVTQEDGTVRLTLNTASDLKQLNIKVSTTVEQLTKDQQASASMVASPYKPTGGNYLHIGVTGGEFKIGENAVINFIIRNTDPDVRTQITHYNYVIMNKGRIMKVGTQERSKGQTLVTMSLSVTEEFIPSFRILAYYTVDTGSYREVVADSLWIDVEDTCMGTLRITGEKDRDNMIQQPGSSMMLKLQADHKATVGLVAVDRGVYAINSKLKINQGKVWESVEKYDIGCTPGCGADTPGVFYDAGLALQTNFQITTPQRSEPICQPQLKRRRRASAILIQERDKKASQYSGLEKTCCKDGMLKNPMGHTCERRTRHIQDGQKCIDAFLDCCKHIQKQIELEKELHKDDDDARSDEDSDYIEDSDIIIRSQFPETWLWVTKTMSEIPDDKGVSSKAFKLHLQDSITTWEVLAVSLSENKGICVSKPHNIQVMMNFFIDLRLPYSVVRNEQIEIRAILYNYGNSQIKTRVDWTYNEKFCSLSTAKKRYRQEVIIKPTSSVAVPFVIIPLELGEHEIEVKAAGAIVSDGVRKTLKVVPEGRRLTQALKSVILDPQLKGGVQEERVTAIKTKNVVPNTKVSTIVTIPGSPISEMIEKTLDGKFMTDLFEAPSGCAEQNMVRVTAPLIAVHFMDSSQQWEGVGVDLRDQGIEYIKQGVENQLTISKRDGSYDSWNTYRTSTWLTAYVVKVFSLAKRLIDFNRDNICKPVRWLIEKTQNKEGKFTEDSFVYQQELGEGIREGAKELDSSLTAFVLVALLESEDYCKDKVDNLTLCIGNATDYLNKKYLSLETPYSIALTSYALAKAGKLQDTKKLMGAATDNNHWEESDSRMLSLEATSYALLTLLKMKDFEKAGVLVKWITEQRYYGEVWGSTQSTMMQFEALAQYHIDVPTYKDLDMDVSFTLPGRSQSIVHRLNLNNALLARSEQTSVVGDFTVIAKGKGQGTLRVLSVYYAVETEKEKKCNNFDLSVTIKEEPDAKKPEGAKSTVSMTICTRFLKNHDSTMSILDISMMTGFAPDTSSLDKLKKGVDRYISSFEINKGAFDKGTLILYLDRISHKEEDCVKFYLHQFFEVGLIQPGSVTVYDYYSPENRCTKFYHVSEDSKLLGKICSGEVCRCAEANCFMQQQLDEVDSLVRLQKACEAGVDYVFKTKLTDIQKGDNYNIYVMKIITVIKIGTDEVSVDDERNFIAHIKCKDALNLVIGRDYVIWGVYKDVWNTGSGFSYIITRDTWIEMWPTERECQDDEYFDLCEEFASFSEELEFRGCVRY
ncbi:A.superbus venom factor 1-like isoform X1 [Engystomops pustulosus]|uniref:A.superbus venom factor 1-like isoform X1 n=1 Tax=Engystomops pustulosus TaxID=76066 RepID=UPI003AFB6CB6